jgi:hypothetical protein
MNKFFISLIVLAFPVASYACSFVPGYQDFLVMPAYGEAGKPPNQPVAEVVSIERGYSDGNGASCSDAGIIKIGFRDSNPYHKTGYSFKIIEGTFEDKVFPDGYVRPPDSLDSKNEVMFVWLDGSKNYQEPIDIRVEISAVSYRGVESEPYILHIKHSGGSHR